MSPTLEAHHLVRVHHLLHVHLAAELVSCEHCQQTPLQDLRVVVLAAEFVSCELPCEMPHEVE